MRRIADFAVRVAWVVRRVIGAPDYECYVAHVRRAHPGLAPLPRDAFLREALTRKFERPGSRCC